MAECCLAPALPKPRNLFSRRCFKKYFPQRPVVIVTGDLKTQESFQQDLETWLNLESKVQSPKSKVAETPSSILHPPSSPLFFPAWEAFPHEGKLPHADVISDRLQTLVALVG